MYLILFIAATKIYLGDNYSVVKAYSKITEACCVQPVLYVRRVACTKTWEEDAKLFG